MFGERGPAHTTMDQIAEAAEVSKGTLYLYFRSKDDLFVALTHAPLDVVLERFEVLLADERADGATLLRRMLQLHGETMLEHAPQLRLGFGSMCSGFVPDPEAPSLVLYAERVARLRDTYTGLLERGREDGSLRMDFDVDDTARALWAATFGAAFLRINEAAFRVGMPKHAPARFDLLTSSVTDLILRSLIAPEPAS